MPDLKGNLFRKLILFIVGFCSYITIEVCFRGYSYPVMGICGGVFLILIDVINDKISWDIDILLYSCIGSGIITAMELIIGEVWKYLGLNPMWDYSNIPFNFDGVICLPFSVAWAGISIVGILVADAINYYVFDIMPTPYYVLCNNVIFRFKDKK